MAATKGAGDAEASPDTGASPPFSPAVFLMEMGYGPGYACHRAHCSGYLVSPARVPGKGREMDGSGLYGAEAVRNALARGRVGKIQSGSGTGRFALFRAGGATTSRQSNRQKINYPRPFRVAAAARRT